MLPILFQTYLPHRVFSIVAHQDSERLILHLQVYYFVAIEDFVPIVDTVAIVLLLRLLLHHSAKAMQIIARVIESIVIVSARQLLNLAIDSLLV